MQVQGIYRLSGTSEFEDGIGYFVWRRQPATEDRLPSQFRLPLFKKDPTLCWMPLQSVCNMVRSLAWRHSPFQNARWVHTMPDYSGRPLYNGENFCRLNMWLRHAPRLFANMPRLPASAVVPNARV